MKIYKYRSLNGENEKYTTEIATHSRIYFSKYDELNDPFEYSFSWKLTAAHAKKLEFWSNLATYYREELLKRDLQEQEQFITQQEQELAAPNYWTHVVGRDQGIFSCSTEICNLVLWSHYADSHRGICFEFETEEDNTLKHVIPVKYENDPAEWNLYSGVDLFDVLTTKFVDWRYEKEVRVPHKAGIYEYNSKALTAMYIGLQAYFDEKVRKKVGVIIEYLQTHRKDAKIFYASTDPGQYKLRYKPLEAPWPRV